MKTIAFFLVFLSLAAAAQTQLIRTQSEAWDNYVQQYVTNGDFSGNILIVKDKTILFSKSYGKANYELNSPMLRDTRFRIASVSKTFTAAAIVLLVNRGRLNLSDKLSKFIPGFVSGDSISIAHLLLHQSGIADIDYDEYALDRLSGDDVAKLLATKPLYFRPGTSSRYSNSGYFILAQIIEKVSGDSYEKFLASDIFNPLGMLESGADHSGLVVPNKASGYSIGAGANGIAQALWMNIDMAAGSGSIYSTTGDLIKWLQAIDANTLFDINSLVYPFGWGTREHFGKKCILQSGFINGYASFISYYPSERLYIVALSNISSNFNEQSGKDLAAIYFKENYTIPEKRVEQAHGRLDRYTGKFQWPGYKQFFIEEKDGGINWRFADEKTGTPLAPISENVFLLRLMNTKIVFNNGVDKATELTFGNGADTTICKRIE